MQRCKGALSGGSWEGAAGIPCVVGMAWAKIESSGQAGGQKVDLTEPRLVLLENNGSEGVKIDRN